MPLSTSEAFKFGFLTRCADEGLSAEQVAERIHRGGEVVQMQKQAGGAADTGKSLLGLGIAPFLWGNAAAIGLAAGGGLLASKMTERDVDADEYKQRELIDQYREIARRARAAAAHRQRLAAKPQTTGMAFA